jgi:4-diphosphocytidyl-2-C-methyl-D-erythritol kinase
MRSTAGEKPGSVVRFPNCKINLGLRILRKREDGYHDLETVFYPLPLKDVLEAIRLTDADAPGQESQGVSQPSPNAPIFTAYGLSIPGDPAGNLCLKAWQLLKQDFPTLPSVHFHLYKHIPIGAGLGGGSSDGASTLLLLNKQFQLGLSTERLLYYAARLGSDVPFFILNTPCLGGGRGELLTPLKLDLSAYRFVIVNPGLHISTAQAFSLCQPHTSGPAVKDIIGEPIHTWSNLLVNDFETPVFHLHPSLRQIKENLYAQGALYAALSGSGSSLFGIFEKGRLPALSFGEGHNVINLE